MGRIHFSKRKTGDAKGEVDFVEPKLNLLAHAQTIELFLGSRCGGHGVCGGDRVKVQVDLKSPENGSFSSITEAERKHLSDHEIGEGYRLACQCFPESSFLEFSVEIQ